MSQTTDNAATNEVTYMPFNDPNGGTTSIQGIRGVTGSDNVYLAGSLSGIDGTTVFGLIYEGPVANEGNSGNWYQYSYPSSQDADVINTSCYGPNNGTDGNIQVVGSYKTTQSVNGNKGAGAMGFYYEGPVDGSGSWTTIHPNDGDTYNCYAHSTMEGLVVGCYNVNSDTNGHSFIYDVATEVCDEFKVEGAYVTSIYGIWYNGGSSYTIAGGYSDLVIGDSSMQAFVADYDAVTKNTSNLKAYAYTGKMGKAHVTHFQGITGVENGYNLPGTWIGIGENGIEQAFQAHIPRNEDGTIGDAIYTDLVYPNGTGSNKKCLTLATSSDKNHITGIYLDGAVSPPVTFSYIATVN